MLVPTVDGQHSLLLYIADVMAKIRYLFDTGAELTCLPANQFSTYRQETEKRLPCMVSDMFILTLVYANAFPGFSLLQMFLCRFIGIDLLHHNLLIDTRKRELVGGNTMLSVCVTFFSVCRLSLVFLKNTIDPCYQWVLEKYLSFTKRD